MRRAHFRDQMIAASLKHGDGAYVEREKRQFPRSNDRGLIEARDCDRVDPCGRIDFRDQMIAASLKRGFPFTERPE